MAAKSDRLHRGMVVFARLSKILVFLSIAALLAGCKLAVMVPPGAKVQSSSGTRNCDGGAGGKFCTFDLTLSPLPFSESFTVTPRPGYQFVKWQKADGFHCGDSTSVTCTVSIAAGGIGQATLAAFETGYLMPVLKDVGVDTDSDGVLDHADADDDNDGLADASDNCPLRGPNLDGFGCPNQFPGDILVAGKRWAQLSLFGNLTLAQISSVCGSGVCNGSLNGRNISGWSWATTAEVAELFDNYRIPTPPSYQNWLSCAYFGSAWSPTSVITNFGEVRVGYASDSTASSYPLIFNNVNNGINAPYCTMSTQTNLSAQGLGTGFPIAGWFYR